MALQKGYSWYIENGQIAIVEPNSDSEGTQWKAVSTSGKTINIRARSLATDFNSTLTDDDKTINLPNKYRRVLSDLVISRGYEMPPNIELKLAAHFYNKYRTQLREMKKARNSNLQSTGIVSGWYY